VNELHEVDTSQAIRWFRQAGWELRRMSGTGATWTKNGYVYELPASGTARAAHVLMEIGSVDGNDLSKLEPMP
jgi:hypothetical protein